MRLSRLIHHRHVHARARGNHEADWQQASAPGASRQHDHDGLSPWWTDPLVVTLNGDTAEGAWAKGQYKFTLKKVQ